MYYNTTSVSDDVSDTMVIFVYEENKIKIRNKIISQYMNHSLPSFNHPNKTILL